MGGDTIVVCNLASSSTPSKRARPDRHRPARRARVAAGHLRRHVAGRHLVRRPAVQHLGYEFGPKPFDPFPKIPDRRERGRRVGVPARRPVRSIAGNDIIDASALFADPCTQRGNLPTVGFTAYGGAGNDLIIGSQAGDHLAGGSGRRHDPRPPRRRPHLRRLRRQREHLHARRSRSTSINPARCRRSTSGTGAATARRSSRSPSLNADRMDAGPRPDIRRGRRVHDRAADSLTVTADARFDDIIFGDHGRDPAGRPTRTCPTSLLQRIQTTTLASVRGDRVARIPERRRRRRSSAASAATSSSAAPAMTWLDGDQQDDMVFGDNIFLPRRVVEPRSRPRRLRRPRTNTTSGASRRCAERCCTAAPTADACGVTGRRRQRAACCWSTAIARQNYRDPDSGAGGVDAYPWWAEYLVDYDNNIATRTVPHLRRPSEGTNGAGSFGNDYIAGGGPRPAVRPDGQRHRSRATAASRMRSPRSTSHVGALAESRERVAHAGGCTGTRRARRSATTSAISTSSPRSRRPPTARTTSRATRGDDIVFGGLGQDDIIGGSSELLQPDHAGPAARRRRHDFRRRRHRIDRNDDTSDAPERRHRGDQPARARRRHDRRRQRQHHPDRRHQWRRPHRRRGAEQVRDRSTTTTRTARCRARRARHAAARLHAGRPGLRRTCSPPASEPGCNDRRQRRSTCRVAATSPARDKSTTSAATTRSTARPATTPSNRLRQRRRLRRAEDDDMIGGWGNDWISGGTGEDGILGDDGRIFTSRNTRTAYGEAAASAIRRHAAGERSGRPVLERATCSTSSSTRRAWCRRRRSTSHGELKKAVDLTPFKVDAERPRTRPDADTL